MTTFTVEIQASSADGTIWQAMAPAETVDTVGWGTNWTAKQVAEVTAEHQTVTEKPYRVAVWEGADADTSTEPAYVLDVEVEPEDILADLTWAARHAQQWAARRDDLIRVAMARDDIPRATIAAAARLSESRVYQIRNYR